jgi:hypothetical protein
VSGDLNEWVLSLPWVVEQESGVGGGVRFFGVDCEPLQRRRVWLITGFPEISSGDAIVTIAAVMPAMSRLGTVVAGRKVYEVLPRAAGGDLVPALPLPPGHVLVTPRGHARHQHHTLEAFVLDAYEHALS